MVAAGYEKVRCIICPGMPPASGIILGFNCLTVVNVKARERSTFTIGEFARALRSVKHVNDLNPVDKRNMGCQAILHRYL